MGRKRKSKCGLSLAGELDVLDFGRIWWGLEGIRNRGVQMWLGPGPERWCGAAAPGARLEVEEEDAR